MRTIHLMPQLTFQALGCRDIINIHVSVATEASSAAKTLLGFLRVSSRQHFTGALRNTLLLTVEPVTNLGPSARHHVCL